MAVTSKPTAKALEMRFGIISDELIKEMSVTEINNEHLLDREMKFQDRGVCDPKLGTTDRDVYCGTCGCSEKECPGHFGHIELA